MARVIRRPGERVRKRAVLDAEARADAILADAHVEAERLLDDARTQAEALRDEARREGEAEAHAATVAALLRATAAHDRALDDAQAELPAIVVGAARQILDAELALAPEKVQAIVRGVLARAARAKEVSVRVHPDDLAQVTAMPELAGARVEGDAALERGDCVVRTELGILDGSLRVQLEALRRALSA